MNNKSIAKNIREQLITLSIEIDDKEKLGKILERKIENERQNLNNLELTVKEEFQSKLEVRIYYSLE
jgi:hypothetical protein